MLVLFDHVTLAGIARVLSRHTVVKSKERGWDRLSNGDLLTQAERAGFDVLLTAEKNMRYQQNLAGRRIALVVLSTPQWPLVYIWRGLRRRSTAQSPAAIRKWKSPAARDLLSSYCALVVRKNLIGLRCSLFKSVFVTQST